MKKKVIKYTKRNKTILLFTFIYSISIFVFSPLASLLYDSALYVDIAKNMIRDLCFCSNFQPRPYTPPIFPLIVAGSMLLSGSFFIKVLLAGISFFGIMISYHFILKISNNRRTSFLSSVLFFSTPLVIYNSMLLLMDLIFGILIILSTWSYIIFLEKKTSKWLIILAGIMVITIMTKMVGYLLIPIYTIHFVIDRKSHKIGLDKILIVLLLITTLLLPWTLWRSSAGGLNEVNVGDLVVSGEGYGHILLRIESFYSSGEPMNANPLVLDVSVPPHVVNISRILISLFIYVTPFITLYFIYYLTNFKKQFMGRYDSLLLLWIFAFLVFFTFGFFYFSSRYLIPMILPVVFFFARFLVLKMGKRKLLTAFIIAVQILSVIAITYVDSRLMWSKSQTEIFTQSGEWLKANTNTNATVLALGAPEGALVYYGERKVISYNTSSQSGVPDFVVWSNFSQAIRMDEYENQTGVRFGFVQSFSDRMYYSEIYKREM